MTMMMRFASALSEDAHVLDAAERACQKIKLDLKGLPCDIAWVFLSLQYQADWQSVLAHIRRKLGTKVLIGNGASGVIGGGQEVEWAPAVSIVGAAMPEVRLHPFSVAPEELEESAPGGFWIDKAGAFPDDDPDFTLLVDPYTVEPEQIIDEIGETYLSSPIVGGLTSGGQEPGENLLFLGEEVLREGAVGVAFTGNIAMDTLVSQGCRPIGRPYVVTDAEDNLIYGLAGRPAMKVLHEVLSEMDEDDRELAQQGALFLGIVVDEMRTRYISGDFLIRNLIGVDPDEGVIAISDQIDVGRTVQFHLRDATTARQELRRLLHQFRQDIETPPAGGLLFNCTGRGRSMYGTQHHDIRTIRAIGGDFPVGGVFCSGEIGPCGDYNCVHGYTASLGIFRPLKVPLPKKPLRKHLGRAE